MPPTTPELLKSLGFKCEEHIVETADGYILVLHRLFPRSESSSNTSHRTPVLFIHGAMLSSEIWVCFDRKKRSLALTLTDQGYDVWLLNRRGNRYSQKHSSVTPDTRAFWDFSIDECIRHDLPASVDHVLRISAAPKVVLVGFSQGTAEIFGSLSINPPLVRKVSCVIALSATMVPRIIPNALTRSMIRWTPELVFLIFGRLSMLSSVFFWQGCLSPGAYVWSMDMAMYLLFGWDCANIKKREKNNFYRHLYSQASVKQIVHWFQIMRAGRFQMYDDCPSTWTVVPEYPVSNVETPVLAISGSRDCLANVAHLTSHLRNATIHCIPGYEHIDPLWAHDAHTIINPKVVEFLSLHLDLVPKSKANISSITSPKKKNIFRDVTSEAPLTPLSQVAN